MSDFRHWINLVELRVMNDPPNNRPPTRPPRGGSPWDDEPDQFDEYTVMWVRGTLIVRCKLGSPGEDFLQRRDALRNYDVFDDPSLAGVDLEADPDGGALFGAAMNHGFVMVHIDWHQLTNRRDAESFDRRDIQRHLKNATATSGYDMNVIAKDEPTAKAAAKLMISKYGDMPSKLTISVVHDNQRTDHDVVGPEIRSFLR
jgi:hypothetical protein